MAKPDDQGWGRLRSKHNRLQITTLLLKMEEVGGAIFKPCNSQCVGKKVSR